MRIGSFAGISFYVSDDTVRTLQDLSWSASAKYATHQRHNNKDLPEMTGTDLQQASFNMTLSAYLGTDPTALFKKLVSAVESGKVSSLVLGRQRIGKQWVAKSAQIQSKQFDGHGAMTIATVKVTLLEYPSS